METNAQDVNLNEFTLFQGVDESAVKAFLSSGYTFSYPAGEPIVVKDDAGETFFLILGGLAKIVLANAAKDEVNITLFRAGDFFGELSILEDRPSRTANVIAVTDVEVAALQKNEFLKLVERYPKLGLNMARVMGQRLRAMNDRLVSLSMPEENRVARTLLQLARQGKSYTDDGPILLPGMALSEWVLFCKTSSDQFMASMEKLREAGAIEWQNQRIVVKDLELLAKYAAGVKAVAQ